MKSMVTNQLFQVQQISWTSRHARVKSQDHSIDRLTTPLRKDVKSRRWELGSFITAPRWSGSLTLGLVCRPKGILCFGKPVTGWPLLSILAGSIGATYTSIKQLVRVQKNQSSELSLRGPEQDLKQL